MEVKAGWGMQTQVAEDWTLEYSPCVVYNTYLAYINKMII